MIPVDEAREILGDKQISDLEIQNYINELQLLVELMYDKWTEEQKKLHSSKKMELKS